MLQYLKDSLVSLETTCHMLHIDCLTQTCISNLEELVLHDTHMMSECYRCEIKNLMKFTQLQKLVFVNVTNFCIKPLSNALSQVGCTSRLVLFWSHILSLEYIY